MSHNNQPTRLPTNQPYHGRKQAEHEVEAAGAATSTCQGGRKQVRREDETASSASMCQVTSETSPEKVFDFVPGMTVREMKKDFVRKLYGPSASPARAILSDFVTKAKLDSPEKGQELGLYSLLLFEKASNAKDLLEESVVSMDIVTKERRSLSYKGGRRALFRELEEEEKRTEKEEKEEEEEEEGKEEKGQKPSLVVLDTNAVLDKIGFSCSKEGEVSLRLGRKKAIEAIISRLRDNPQQWKIVITPTIFGEVLNNLPDVDWKEAKDDYYRDVLEAMGFFFVSTHCPICKIGDIYKDCCALIGETDTGMSTKNDFSIFCEASRLRELSGEPVYILSSNFDFLKRIEKGHASQPFKEMLQQSLDIKDGGAPILPIADFWNLLDGRQTTDACVNCGGTGHSSCDLPRYAFVTKPARKSDVRCADCGGTPHGTAAVCPTTTNVNNSQNFVGPNYFGSASTTRKRSNPSRTPPTARQRRGLYPQQIPPPQHFYPPLAAQAPLFSMPPFPFHYGGYQQPQQPQYPAAMPPFRPFGQYGPFGGRYGNGN